MSQSLSIIVAIVVFIGIIFKYFIFRRESADEKPHHFFTSRILLEFTVDIIIIFLGHFISMGITQWDNDIKEHMNIYEELQKFILDWCSCKGLSLQSIDEIKTYS